MSCILFLQEREDERQRAEMAKRANDLLTYVDAPTLWNTHLPLRDYDEILKFDQLLLSDGKAYTDFVSVEFKEKIEIV